MLRIAKGGDESGNAAAQVDVKTFGPMTCSTVTPPKNLEVKGGEMAAIEITARTKNDVVPIDKLRPVAEKMAGRF
jgi:hypothetical protein